MKLSEIIAGAPDIQINGVKSDSREVEKGDLYICIKGEYTDGHNLAKQALLKGAVAVVCEESVGADVEIIVPSTRLASSYIYSAYYNNPQNKLKMIGVTGTNGKTSTVSILSHIFETAGIKSASLGTLGFGFNGSITETGNTTPLPDKMYKLLDASVKNGIKYVFSEVSSHAISLGRVAPITFDAGIYTNLTPEHLDYHKDMNEYASVKASLFKQCRKGFFNIDDEYCRSVYKSGYCEGTLYGIDKRADYRAENIVLSKSGVKYTLDCTEIRFDIQTALVGMFGVYNTLAASSLALTEGISPKTVCDALESFDGVVGRMQTVYNGKFTVIIDYAHTPDALEKAIEEIRKSYPDSHLTLVFGCGGNRDRSKRPIMGNISQKADRAIITSDNSRYEKAEDIISEISIGNPLAETITDRKQAIEYALSSASEKEVILIAGKGHEEYELVSGEKRYFSERRIIKEFLEANNNRQIT